MFASRTLVFRAHKPSLKKYSEVHRLTTASGSLPISIVSVNFKTVSYEANFKIWISDANSFKRHKYLEMPSTCNIWALISWISSSGRQEPFNKLIVKTFGIMIWISDQTMICLSFKELTKLYTEKICIYTLIINRWIQEYSLYSLLAEFR